MNADTVFVRTGLPLPSAQARVLDLLGQPSTGVHPEDPAIVFFAFGDANGSISATFGDFDEGWDLGIHLENRFDRHRGAKADARRVFDLIAEHTDWPLELDLHDEGDEPAAVRPPMASADTG